ncbi:hypothetical protein [Actinomadura kijaniata]|uniref:hypothetical protein n=1 Tax=Actinomadura kijaniata TaxID=46161 RepID=UPI00083330C2|nr:hypothetical protein [Actinomadura kijaniata]
MWWDKLRSSLGDLIGGLVGAGFRCYAETEVGAQRKLFLLTPGLANDLDTDGSGGADLRVWFTPHLALPPDGLAVTFERRGNGVPGLSARVFIGIDGGVFPVGSPPASMRFAFFGFEGAQETVAPDRLRVDLTQRAKDAETHLDVRLSTAGAAPGVRFHTGMITGPVAIIEAERVPGPDNRIRTADLARAIDRVDARLLLGQDDGGPLALTDANPLRVEVDTAPTGTSLRYTAPGPLTVGFDVENEGAGGYLRLAGDVDLMPDRLSADIKATTADVTANGPLRVHVRGAGLPLPLAGLASATAELDLPARPLKVSWGPAPLRLSVALGQPIAGTPATGLALNAHLLRGMWNVQFMNPPPLPGQAVVGEYDDGNDLWLAINTLENLRLRHTQDGSQTTADAELILGMPRTGDTAPPPRSLRVTVRRSGRLFLDARSSGLDPVSDNNPQGVLRANIDLDTGSADVRLTGRLRHLRARHDDGTAITEAWTPVTPPDLRVRARYDTGLDVTVTPAAAMALTGDRIAYGGNPLGQFARVFARLLVNAPLRGRYVMMSRLPEITGKAVAPLTVDTHTAAPGTAFPPEIKGMSLRYETGVNCGVARTITGVFATRVTTQAFPAAPSVDDRFTVVAPDVTLEASGALQRPSTRKGVSLVASAATARDRRLATRIHPQVVRQTTRVLANTPPRPDTLDTVAVRIEGITDFRSPSPNGPGQAFLAFDLSFDPSRPRRSLRYAENRRWLMSEEMRVLLGADRSAVLRPAPRVRALLADLPDQIMVRSTAGPGRRAFRLARVGGSGHGWVWAMLDQHRCTGEFAGTGLLSLDLSSLPLRTGVILADDLADVRRSAPPGDVMWPSPAGWLAPSSQTVTISGGDLRLDRVVYASFWPGRLNRTGANIATSQSYPTRDQDEWDLITADFAVLRDTGANGQQVTIWMIDSTDWDNPDRGRGVAVETAGLNADVIVDQYWALLPPRVRDYATVPWVKTAEIELYQYTGAWAMVNDSLIRTTPNYEKPDEDTGFWFLRAIGVISGIGDAYFGNTSGNINGKQRPPWPT